MATTTPRADNREVYERLCDAIVGKRPLDETILDPDVVKHRPQGGTLIGSEVFIREGEALLRAFPESKVIIADTVSEGDRLAARIIVESGPNSGESYMGYGSPETRGNAFGMEEMNIVRISDGRIAEIWIEADMVSMTEQFGIVPS